jgi:hypothetical protein
MSILEQVPNASVEPPPVAWKRILLPVEHGGWGFLFEPLLLGLLVAPSRANGALALSAVAAFLVRHPLKLALGDRQRGRRYPRTSAAEGAALGWALVALLGLGGAVAFGGPTLLWPLVAAAPLALLQLAFDVRNRNRELLPELAGALALAATAPAMFIAVGLGFVPAAIAYVFLGLRAASAILYVRCRLRLTRGTATSRWPQLLAHALGLLVMLLLASFRLQSWLAVAAFAILLARALHGLAPAREPMPPRRIGLQELGFGLATTLLVALGVRFSL